MPFVYKIIHEAPLEDMVAIYRSVGWWVETWSPEAIAGIAPGSTVFVGVFDHDRMIAMGRAISDGVSDSCIQDVAVLKEFQGQGIGGKIIRMLVAELRERGIDWIQLIGAPGTEDFYRKLGFEVMQDHVPMRYSN